MHSASRLRNHSGFSELQRSVLAARSQKAVRWINEDFAPPDRPDVRIADPWSPLAVTGLAEERIFGTSTNVPPRDAAETELEPNTGESLWFEPNIDADADQSPPDRTDWAYEAALPTFTPRAAINPFEFDATLPTSEDFARRRASALVDLLEVNTQRLRRKFGAYFLELFADFPYPSTFETLAEIARNGASPDEIWTAYQVKQIWINTPLWWSKRIFGKSCRFSTPSLSWVQAVSFAERRKGIPSEEIIEPEWFDEWDNLHPHDPLYSSFILYVDARIEAFESGYTLFTR